MYSCIFQLCSASISIEYAYTIYSNLSGSLDIVLAVSYHSCTSQVGNMATIQCIIYYIGFIVTFAIESAPGYEGTPAPAV